MKSRFEKASELKFNSPFSWKEIYIARKCIINKLSKPPNYDITDVRGNDAESQTVIVNQDKSFEIKPLDDFNIPNLLEPSERPFKGQLIQDFDMVGLFDQIFIYHNEHKYPHKKWLSVPNALHDEFVVDEENEMLFFPNEQKEGLELFVAFQANMISNEQGMPILPQLFL